MVQQCGPGKHNRDRINKIDLGLITDELQAKLENDRLHLVDRSGWNNDFKIEDNLGNPGNWLIDTTGDVDLINYSAWNFRKPFTAYDIFYVKEGRNVASLGDKGLANTGGVTRLDSRTDGGGLLYSSNEQFFTGETTIDNEWPNVTYNKAVTVLGSKVPNADRTADECGCVIMPACGLTIADIYQLGSELVNNNGYQINPPSGTNWTGYNFGGWRFNNDGMGHFTVKWDRSLGEGEGGLLQPISNMAGTYENGDLLEVVIYRLRATGSSTKYYDKQTGLFFPGVEITIGGTKIENGVGDTGYYSTGETENEAHRTFHVFVTDKTQGIDIRVTDDLVDTVEFGTEVGQTWISIKKVIGGDLNVLGNSTTRGNQNVTGNLYVTGDSFLKAVEATNVTILEDLFVAGKSRFGSLTNNSTFDSSGRLTMTGNARVKKEMMIRADATRKGASAPTDILRTTGASGTLLAPLTSFSKTTKQDVYFTFHSPNDVDESQDVEFHLLWIPGASWTSGNYLWKLEYLIKGENTTINTETPTTITMDVTPTNNNTFIETIFTSTINLDREQVLIGHFYRDVDDTGNDTGDVAIFEISYLTNSLGVAL